jgi:prevent-host-death family protein
MRRENRIIRFVSDISATEASKRFADVLDAVEHRGETFTVVRRGRVVATIAPARSGTGADLRRILAEHPPDDRWADDLRELRRFAGDAPVGDPWND